MKVLKLSAQGLPQSWITLEQAVIHYAAGEVRWESGGEVAVFRGGHNAITGQQSIITVNSIIGTRGVPNINPFNLKPGLTNSKLFARDRFICIRHNYSSIPIRFFLVQNGSTALSSLNRSIRASDQGKVQGPRISSCLGAPITRPQKRRNNRGYDKFAKVLP